MEAIDDEPKTHSRTGETNYLQPKLAASSTLPDPLYLATCG